MTPIAAVGDAEILLEYGAPLWMICLCGLSLVLSGLRLWHGLAPEFGWGANAQDVTVAQAAVTAAVLAAVIVLECTFSPQR